MPGTRVLIVEDEPLFRDLMSKVLAADCDIEVVGSTGDGTDAVRKAHDTEPDAVLMDIQLGGEIDGIEAAIEIKRNRPATGIVILSAHNDRRYVTSLPLDEMPGWSYLLKQTAASTETVIRAIKTSIEGGLMIDPSIIGRLKPRKNSRLDGLRPRLQQVLRLIAQGYNNTAIARRMSRKENPLKIKTVEAYTNELYSHLGLAEEQDINPRVKAAIIFLEESQNTPEAEASALDLDLAREDSPGRRRYSTSSSR